MSRRCLPRSATGCSGFFHPSARVSLFTFLTFHLQQISSIPSFTLKTYSPQVTINLLPYYIPRLYQGSLPPPTPQLVILKKWCIFSQKIEKLVKFILFFLIIFFGFYVCANVYSHILYNTKITFFFPHFI